MKNLISELEYLLDNNAFLILLAMFLFLTITYPIAKKYYKEIFQKDETFD